MQLLVGGIYMLRIVVLLMMMPWDSRWGSSGGSGAFWNCIV